MRPKFEEPRIHFALVCAAVGCPPLRNEAYTAQRLEEQLQSQTDYVHRHTTWFQFERATNRADLTKLYGWYGGDFEQVTPNGSVLEFAARYSPWLKQALDQGKNPDVGYLPYDWSLNDIANRKPR